MTRFEWFEHGYGQQALNLGIISTSMFARYIQFKVYSSYRDAGSAHIEAIEKTAEEVKCSVSTVWKAVYFFVKSPELE